MADSRKEEIKQSLFSSFDKTFKKAMHNVLGPKKSKELIDDIFDELWEKKFQENRKPVQTNIENIIKNYLNSE